MIDINALWEEKVTKLSYRVKRIARGNDDCYQQGMLGIRDGLLKDPYGTDSFLLESAKFAMLNYKNKGKSVDNGSKYPVTKTLLDGTVKTYRKNMTPIYIDKLVSEFQLEFPDSSYLPDVLAIDRICAENFYRSLDKDEAEFINAYSSTRHGDFSDRKTMQKMGVGYAEYHRIKQSTYIKFLRAFGNEEEIERLDKQLAYASD